METHIRTPSIATSPPRSKRGGWLVAVVASSSLFVGATWALAVHCDSHQYPGVPSGSFNFPFHELTTSEGR
jgi:hypothetical protein